MICEFCSSRTGPFRVQRIVYFVLGERNEDSITICEDADECLARQEAAHPTRRAERITPSP